MEEQKKQGGKRKGAGRKPVLSKKKQISLYIEGAKILKFGSEEKMKESILDFVDKFGNDAIVYVTAAADAYDGSKKDRITYDEPAMFAEPKSPITGLPPKLSDFDKFSEELHSAKSRHDVEAIMKRSLAGLMFPRERMALKAVADEMMLDMFAD